MKTLSKIFAVLVFTATLASGLAACSIVSGRETAGQYVDDTAISTRIKADLAGDPSIKPFQINVETMQGVVQLSGFVDSQQTADKAGAIARAVPSVKDVHNDLVVPTTYRK